MYKHIICIKSFDILWTPTDQKNWLPTGQAREKVGVDNLTQTREGQK